MTVRVLVVDDHPLYREGLVTVLATLPDSEVVGEADNGEQAVRLAHELAPDVVLMDLHMPGLGGVEATRRIVAASPHVGVVVLSMVEDDDAVFAAMQAGARGYLLKGTRRSDIVRAVTAVGEGGAVFGAGIARRLMRYFAWTRPVAETGFPQLTARELEILQLVAAHLTNPEIADRLGLRPKTVRNNVSSILTKLCVADRAQAIVAAREAGLGGPP